MTLLFGTAHLTASFIFLRSSSKEASMPPQCGRVQSHCKALSGLLPLRRYQVPGEKGEGGHEQPGVGHGDLSRQLQVIRQDYREGYTYTSAPRSGCKNLSRRSETARGRWPPPCLVERHRRHGELLRLRPCSPGGLRYRG